MRLKPRSARSSIAIHEDCTDTGFLDPPCLLSVGLAPDDVTAENGCLYVIDGSHAWRLVGDFETFAAGLEQDLTPMFSPSPRDAIDRDRGSLEVRAGDVTVHHCLALHASGANRTDTPRTTELTHPCGGGGAVAHDRLPPARRHQSPADGDGHLASPVFPALSP